MKNDWRGEKTLFFTKERVYGEGYAHLGFHGPTGEQYVLAHWAGWVGELDGEGALLWSAGAAAVPDSRVHIDANLAYPMYISRSPEGAIYVSCYSDRSIYRLFPIEGRIERFVDGATLGFADIGNCLVDDEGYLWVNEVEGRRVWRIDPSGAQVRCIGSGREQREQILPCFSSFEEASFGWIADIRLGPGGSIYILDSGGLALWKTVPATGKIERIAGTGRSGYSGDGGPALEANFGHDSSERFGAPISLAVDEEGNAYVGDKVNSCVRMVEASSGRISTIAAGLSGLCSMDYYRDRLFLPEESGRLLILKRENDFS